MKPLVTKVVVTYIPIGRADVAVWFGGFAGRVTGPKKKIQAFAGRLLDPDVAYDVAAYEGRTVYTVRKG
jgi:hypothetical protein